MFDESDSMKDDQLAIKDKFDRITRELTLHADPEHKDALALTHAIVSFGKDLHFRSAQAHGRRRTGRQGDRQAAGGFLGEGEHVPGGRRRHPALREPDQQGAASCFWC